MMEFDRLVPDALAFFDDLAANNTRDWFAENKPRYDDAVKRPAQALLDVVGARIAAETGAVQVPKLYRVHRDLRFSKDKTPYNTHLHVQWSDKATGMCHLFGVSRNYVCAGVGAMGFDKRALGAWRNRIAAADGAGFAALVDALKAAGFRLDPPALRRVPAPHPQDHPRAALLKRKGILLWHDFSDDEKTRPAATLDDVFTRLAPFRTALAEVLAPG